MKIKTGKVNEINLVSGESLTKDAPATIYEATWNDILKAYTINGKYVFEEKEEDKGVVELEGHKFLFTYDEDSKQKVLFVDRKMVTNIKVEGNTWKIYTTNSAKPKVEFEVQDEKAAGASNKLVSAEKVLNALYDIEERCKNYLTAKAIEDPILAKAQKEVEERNDRISELNNKNGQIDDKLKNLKSQDGLNKQELEKKLNTATAALVAANATKEKDRIRVEQANVTFYANQIKEIDKDAKKLEKEKNDNNILINKLTAELEGEDGYNAKLEAANKVYADKVKKPTESAAEQYLDLVESDKEEDKKAAESYFAGLIELQQKEVAQARADLAKTGDVGLIYANAREIFAQEKYADLYNVINGMTPLFYAKDVKTEDGIGCVVVGQKLTDNDKVNGYNKQAISLATYYIPGKTAEEVKNALPQKAEDFVALGAKVVKHFHSNEAFTKAHMELFGSSEVVDGKKFASSKKENVKLAIEEKPEDAKEGEFYLTKHDVEVMKADLEEKLKKDGGDVIWEADYEKVRKHRILKGVLFGVGALILAGTAAKGTYDVVQVITAKDTAVYKANLSQMKDATADAKEYARKYVREHGITYAITNDTAHGDDKLAENGVLDKIKNIPIFEDTQDINGSNGKKMTITRDAEEAEKLYRSVMTEAALQEAGRIAAVDLKARGNDVWEKKADGTEVSLVTRYDDEIKGMYGTADYKNFVDGFNSYAKELAKDPDALGEGVQVDGIDATDPDIIQAIEDELFDEKLIEIEGSIKAVYAKDKVAFAVTNDGMNVYKFTFNNDIISNNDIINALENGNPFDKSYTNATALDLYAGREEYANTYVSDKYTKAEDGAYVYTLLDVSVKKDKLIFGEYTGYPVVFKSKNNERVNTQFAKTYAINNNTKKAEGYLVGKKQGDKTEYKFDYEGDKVVRGESIFVQEDYTK